MDGPMDRWTDRPSYRDVRTLLKSWHDLTHSLVDSNNSWVSEPAWRTSKRAQIAFRFSQVLLIPSQDLLKALLSTTKTFPDRTIKARQILQSLLPL